jgi:hypothetical protein
MPPSISGTVSLLRLKFTWFYLAFFPNEKAGIPLGFGNPASFKPHRFLWLFNYYGFTNPLLTLANSRYSHSIVPPEI